ncbi:MAG TPA: transcription antitermination factor NusB [Solirubrobacteraceae bacterium]|nr:transcription antitermination factor NusB [Solirubrobacteraceae bacterium]
MRGASSRRGAVEVAPARACAYAVVRRVFERGAYADRALHAEAAALRGRERSQATAIAYTTVQRAATLDHVAGLLCERPLHRLEPPVLAALRTGLAQLLLLDSFPAHAVVHESVALARRHSRGGAPLVNAVLRRAAREGEAILAELDDSTPQRAAIAHSVPEWLASMWWRELGANRARSLLAAVNRPPESAARVNTLLAEPGAVAAALGVRTRPAEGIPEGLVFCEPFDVHGSAAFRRGELMPQSRGSMAVARALAPRAGERILDLCAAPGAKTTHLAALAGSPAALVSIERHPGRARALEATLERMRVPGVRVLVADATEPAPEGPYDRVLVDPPCSGLGTLQSRPDLRWRASEERIRALASLQAAILRAGAAATRPGGTLAYSVCTISARETDAVIDAFLERHGGWSCRARLRTAPDTDGTDGFYVALLRRDGR